MACHPGNNLSRLLKLKVVVSIKFGCRGHPTGVITVLFLGLNRRGDSASYEFRRQEGKGRLRKVKKIMFFNNKEGRGVGQTNYDLA